MKRVQAILLLLLAALTLYVREPVLGQSGEFIIENADATNTLDVTSSSRLNALIDEVAPRFVVQFAHANRYYALTPIPTALDSRLTSLQSRFVLQHAHANAFLNLVPIPGQLDNLLGQLEPRFVLEFANASRELALNYPVELVDDNDAPRGSDIEASPKGETSATISWRTDEYADSTVRCGTESGIYTMTFSHSLYVRAHVVTVTDLSAGTTYYCRVSSTDLSGNTYRSQEFTFVQAEGSFSYLPLILRSH